MATVTNLNYYMDNFLKDKLDLMIQRCTGKKKFDNLIVIDGDEGYGKTTMSITIAHYVSYCTGRKFDVDNVFFDVEKLIDYAISTEEQIIVWDEAALGGLSDQFQSKIQRKLLQLLMVARKKRHFWIFNIPKFFKLREYIILDRAIGLIHIYAKDELELGRFMYFKKKSKELLLYDYKRSKQRSYAKYKDFQGTFGDHLAEQIDEDAYDKKKDEAILSIGRDENLTKNDATLINLKYIFANLKEVPDSKKTELAQVSLRTIQEWRRLDQTHPQAFEFVKKTPEKSVYELPKARASSSLGEEGGVSGKNVTIKEEKELFFNTI